VFSWVWESSTIDFPSPSASLYSAVRFALSAAADGVSTNLDEYFPDCAFHSIVIMAI